MTLQVDGGGGRTFVPVVLHNVGIVLRGLSFVEGLGLIVEAELDFPVDEGSRSESFLVSGDPSGGPLPFSPILLTIFPESDPSRVRIVMPISTIPDPGSSAAVEASYQLHAATAPGFSPEQIDSLFVA